MIVSKKTFIDTIFNNTLIRKLNINISDSFTGDFLETVDIPLICFITLKAIKNTAELKLCNIIKANTNYFEAAFEIVDNDESEINEDEQESSEESEISRIVSKNISRPDAVKDDIVIEVEKKIKYVKNDSGILIGKPRSNCKKHTVNTYSYNTGLTEMATDLLEYTNLIDYTFNNTKSQIISMDSEGYEIKLKSLAFVNNCFILDRKVLEKIADTKNIDVRNFLNTLYSICVLFNEKI